MRQIIDCLLLEHDYSLAFAAVLVCAMGSALTVRLFLRSRRVASNRMVLQLALTSMMAGTCVWATHFLAMLAYDPGANHSYDVRDTILSLCVAIFGIGISFAASVRSRQVLPILAGGTLFGVSIATMHYVGMSAFLIEGTITHDPAFVAASLIAAIILGMITFHRLSYPMTRYCWLGGTVGMVLTICVLHFTGMAGITINVDPTIHLPPQQISDTTMGAVIFSVVSFLMIAGLGNLLVETKIEEETASLLRNATLHDPLTDLPNQAHLQQFLEQKVLQADAGRGVGFTVFTVEFDLYSVVSSQSGQLVSDQILLQLANRMRNALEIDDFIARTGADQFVIIGHGIDNVTTARVFAEKLRDQANRKMTFSDGVYEVQVSIGVSLYPVDGQIPHDLMQRSRYAVQRAKTELPHRICAFDAELDRKSREHDLMVADLAEAIETGQLYLKYQQQNCAHTHEIVGFEVLCRWRHPNLGEISPTVFIPIAEQTGLIRDIGAWVLKTACAEAAHWDIPYRVAVNVAPQQLEQQTFYDDVRKTLQATGLAAKRLELEVTEATVIDDQSNVLDLMRRLQALGIGIAMDDFGTGYSSLATLQAFPFDKIKVDRSFVHNVHCDKQRAAIVRSTLLLGAALDIPVLAEGVEYQDELTFLDNEGCTEVQGFMFGQPLTVEETRKLTGQRTSLQRAS